MRHGLAVTVLVSSLVASSPVLAQSGPPMSGDEFDAHVTGSTLTFHHDGRPYGIEQYLPGRRVMWAFVGDECTEGTWYEQGEMICFIYPNNPDDQCWTFHLRPGGTMQGIFQGPDGPSTELYEVGRSDAPLSCRAPGAGV